MLDLSRARLRSTASPPDNALDRAFALGWRLLGGPCGDLAALALADLGGIDLPPLTRDPQDQARLQAIPPLYLASELEAALLLPAAETLAGLAVSGGLQVDLGSASRPLMRFWQGRHQRLATQERQALYAHLFGGTAGPALVARRAPNQDFETVMINLTEVLHRLTTLSPTASPASLDAELRVVTQAMIDNLLNRAGGLTEFAAHDIFTAVQAALDLLKLAPLQQAVGARDLSQTIQNIGRLYLGQSPPVGLHIERGKSGMVVLTWVVEMMLQVDTLNAPLVPVEPAVLTAATAWLYASLDLAEQGAAETGATSSPSPALTGS